MSNLVAYQGYLKPSSDLPKHILYEDYLELRKQPERYYREKEGKPKALDGFYIDRDNLLIDFCWQTGGRIGDLVRVRRLHLDFDRKILTLNIQKSKKEIKINLSDELCYALLQFYSKYPQREPFRMHRQNAWLIIKRYGNMIGRNLHPHRFRHGLALYLLSKGVHPNIIAYRLGHSDVRTTMQFYCRITPQLEKLFLKEAEVL